MKVKRIISTVLSFAMIGTVMLQSTIAHAEENKVESYELYSCYNPSNVATLTVNGQDVPVRNYTDLYDYAQFSFDGTAEIKVTVNEDISTFSVSPLAKNIEAAAEGKTLTFTITESLYMIVKINNLREIVITADLIDKNAPAESGEGIYNIVTDFGADNTGEAMAQDAIQAAIDAASNAGGGIVYVPKGLYYFDESIVLKSNVDMYLAGGAVIRSVANPAKYKTWFNKSSLNMDGTWLFYTEENTENITIRGRGTIDANGYAMRKQYGYLATILMPIGCSGFTLDGVTLLDGNFWSFIPARCDNVIITNSKHLNENNDLHENDAIDICECQNVLVQHTIAISEDDTYSTKTWEGKGMMINWYGESEELTDVTFDDCVAWSHCATFKVGDGNFQKQSYITFKNSYSYKSMSSLKVTHAYGTPPAEHITFDNIDIEGFGGRDAGYQKWLEFYIGSDSCVRDVTVKNMNVRNVGKMSSRLQGKSENCYYDGVTFENIYIKGSTVPAKTLQEMNITDRNGFVKNITILPISEEPTIDQNNIAHLGTAFDDGEHNYYNGQKSPSNINDCDLYGPDWQYENVAEGQKNLTNVWIGIKFEKAVFMEKMMIHWEEGSRPTASTAGYTVQYSSDGEAWTDLQNAQYSYGSGSRPIDTVTVTNPVTTKYVRINCKKIDNGKGYSPKIFELQILGTFEPYGSEKMGDVNGDGKINSTDFMQVRRHYLGLYTIPEESISSADVNRDGKINSTDFMQIRRHFLGLFQIG